MFNPDQPIQNRDEDSLGRWPFAESLAEAILQYKEHGKRCYRSLRFLGNRQDIHDEFLSRNTSKRSFLILNGDGNRW